MSVWESVTETASSVWDTVSSAGEGVARNVGEGFHHVKDLFSPCDEKLAEEAAETRGDRTVKRLVDGSAAAEAAEYRKQNAAEEQAKADEKARYRANVAERERIERENQRRANEKLEGQKLRQAKWMRENPGARPPALSEF